MQIQLRRFGFVSAFTPRVRAQVVGEVQRLFLLVLGVSIAALGYALFQVPYDIAAGGVSGIGIIVNHFTGWSIGMLYFVLNIPLLVLGFFYLGRWAFVGRTLIAVVAFSVATDLFLRYLPQYLGQDPITGDLLLSSVYAGVVGGIGGGLIYRANATMGGTGIVGRIIQQKTGTPLSQTYLYTDGLIVLTAGVVFGWEIALYAMLTLLLSGMASDYVLEGPSRARTAVIITQHPQEIIDRLSDDLGRGASYWQITGGYTGEPRTLVQCTIYRPQVTELQRIVEQVDPAAFVSIGVTQHVMGEGFSAGQRAMPL